jgi:hypothetical protein
VAEQPNNGISDTYHVPQGTRFDNDTHIDLHMADARLHSTDAVVAAREALKAVVEEPLAVSAVDTLHTRIEPARVVGTWLEYVRNEEMNRNI